jgi:hypothetical protein
MQNTSHLLMIRPVNFGFNAETAVNNAFQVASNDASTHKKALQEFDAFADLLIKNGLDVTIIEDTPEPFTPDSIFPNNWISFHEHGNIILYPMFADNRRKERKQHVLDAIQHKFKPAKIIDLSSYENEHLYLEGTGSMVLDRNNKIAYACLSPRTNKEVLDKFCALTHYTPVVFTAVDASDQLVYHTNVMMCIANQYTVVCLNSIRNKEEKERLVAAIEQTNKLIIPLSLDQMHSFAGNMLQVKNKDGEALLILSSRAYHSLTMEQLTILNKYNRILHASLNTIETAGGGSARCMLAEVFLPAKT